MITILEENWLFTEDMLKPIIFCPTCGDGLLGDNAPHGVKANGEVFHSVVCDCGFHEYCKLEKWTHGEISHK
jgi:hypothetical protein